MMRRRAPWARSSRLALGLAVVSLTLAGCVNLPTGGTIYVKSEPNSDTGSQLVITPQRPGAQWDERHIVQGFLVASGANPDDLSIAKDYLTGTFHKAWHPSSSTYVIDAVPKVNKPTTVSERLTGGQSSAEVSVTSQHLETLVAARRNEPGRLQVSSRPGPYVFKFELVQYRNKWRIDSIIGPDGKTSDSILLLTASDFQRDYLPRNLYYLASGSSRTLVPYPVYIPAQAGQVSGVQQLADAVLKTPPPRSNWLYQAIETAFPPHTKLTAQVSAGNATVTVSGRGARASRKALSQMEAQLFWTLTYAPDSPSTGVNSVELYIGQRLVDALTLPQAASWVPQVPSGPLYYQTLDQADQPKFDYFWPGSNFGSLNTGQAGVAGRTHRVAGVRPSDVALPRGLGRGAFTATAISPPASGGVNIFAGCRGKRVYVATPVIFGGQVLSTDLPGNCTSLSWDNHGDLWAVAGNDVDVLHEWPTGLQRIVNPVSILAQQIASGDIVALKVAPDGRRVAMIVRRKNVASVYVSALTKNKNDSFVYLAQGGPVLTVAPELVNPSALTWWDSNHLLVLERRTGPSPLYEVSLNGGTPVKVLTAPANAVSVTANDPFIAVGTPRSAGRGPAVFMSRGLEGPWIRVTTGRTPTYVG
jgi:hypothetical protein